MRQRHGPWRIEQVDRRIEIEKRQCEHRRRRHAVRQQPEEQVLVAEEAIAREGIGGGQRHRNRDHRIDENVFQRIDIAGIPSRIREDAHVVRNGRLVRPQRHGRDDFRVGLEAHVDEPVDRQQQEDQKQREDDAPSGNAVHHAPPVVCGRSLSALVITV